MLQSATYNRTFIFRLQKYSHKSFTSYRRTINNITFNHIKNTSKFLCQIPNNWQRVSCVTSNIHYRNCSSSCISNVFHKVFYVKAAEPVYSDENVTTNTVEYIPPPPAPPDFAEESLVILNKIGEPTFESLGLGGWSPVGFFQYVIEYLHVTFDLPWWGAISLLTVCIRLCVFPLVIWSQRSVANLNNNMPTIQRFQQKMDEARLSGNQMEFARLTHEMQTFMKEKNVNPLKNTLVPLAQAPIFISMFIGLRRCANLPVESFKDGGMLWFTDLTVADQYYGLPIITCATLFATIKMGADGQTFATQRSPVTKYVLMGLPLLCFPFMINFPAAVLCYWTSSNVFSLVQVSILRIPAVSAYFNIDKIQKHKPDDSSGSNKSAIANIKDSWANGKLISQIEDRRRLDEIKFKKAGMGPLVKTFAHNPVKNKSFIDVKAKVKQQ